MNQIHISEKVYQPPIGKTSQDTLEEGEMDEDDDDNDNDDNDDSDSHEDDDDVEMEAYSKRPSKSSVLSSLKVSIFN